MATPRLTVGIPTCNGERFIADAIQSVLAQGFTDLEIIVVDDQSLDSTLELARSIPDPRITVYENDRRLGIPGNWNRVLDLARGEYVCLFHQDDRMLPDNILRKVRVLDADPTIGFVHSAIEIIVEPSAPYPQARWVEDSAEDFVIDGLAYFRRLLLEGNLICAPTVLARREHLLRAGGFNQELGFTCDYALWMMMCLHQRVAFLSQPLVQYRWHADNETHRYRFETGVQETWVASRMVLSYYRQRAGQVQEVEVLEASVDALTRVRRWAAGLEKGKEWLEAQVSNWRQEVERQEQTILELRDEIAKLHTAREELEGQASNWRQEAARREQTMLELQDEITRLQATKEWLEAQVNNWRQEVERQEHTATELKGWNAQLETAKEWLEAQVGNWRQEAERQEQTATELKGWNAQLETAKAWLEGEVGNWRQEAERQEQTILELRDEVAKLHTAREELEAQVGNWRQEAERQEQVIAEIERDRRRLHATLLEMEEKLWTRIGRRLRLLM